MAQSEEELKRKLEECRKWIHSWAYHGYNGSPFTEKEAQTLSNDIQNDAWKTYVKIFGEDP